MKVKPCRQEAQGRDLLLTTEAGSVVTASSFSASFTAGEVRPYAKREGVCLSRTAWQEWC